MAKLLSSEEMKFCSQITLIVNGETHNLVVKNKETLLETLRNQLELTGTKEGCGTGDCGACTVIVNGKNVNACLMLTVEADGAELATVEGLASADGIHPIQEAFIEKGAVQCGFCTPGMVLSSKALLDNNPHPGEEEIRKALAGNLCRCTGYVKIVGAVTAAAEKLTGER